MAKSSSGADTGGVSLPEYTRALVPDPRSFLNAEIIIVETDGSRAIWYSNGVAWVGASGGTSSFAALTGAPGDNVSLAAALALKSNTPHAITATDHTAGNWKALYTNGAGQIVELPLGAAGTVMQSNGAAVAPTMATPAGGDLAAAEVVTATAMGALAIDVAKELNTKTIAVDSSVTFSGTPAAAHTFFGLLLTNSDTAAHTITVPTCFSATQQKNITTLVIPASGKLDITFRYTGSEYIIYGEPAALYATYTWAAKPASASIGDRIYISDVGTHDGTSTLTEWVWMTVNAATRWFPARDVVWQYHDTLALSVSATEQVGRQALIPAGLLWTGARLERKVEWGKTGTTNTATIRDRIGTAGTIADTVLAGFALVISNATHQTQGYWHDLLILAATTAQHAGPAGGGNSSYSAASGSSLYSASATTITDHAANALYLSSTIQLNTAADTPRVENWRLALLAP